MREFDTIGTLLCAEQAELFEASCDIPGLGSSVFVRRFAYSDVARRFDDLSAINYIFDVAECMQEINGPFPPTTRIGIRYSRETLYWMGYIYRYWCYTREEASTDLYRKIPPAFLARHFEIYHTLDPEQAVERLLEERGLADRSDIAYGVKLYRAILARYKY